MINATIKYPYSKVNGWLFVIASGFVSCFFTFLFLSGDWKHSPKQGIIVFGCIDFATFLVVFRAVWYFLIPALHEETVFEVNESGVINYLENYCIEWANIINMTNETVPFLGRIAFYLDDSKAVTSQITGFFARAQLDKNKIYCGTPIVMRTTFMKSRNAEILNTLIDYKRQTGK
jgi:hypothetical protein